MMLAQKHKIISLVLYLMPDENEILQAHISLNQTICTQQELLFSHWGCKLQSKTDIFRISLVPTEDFYSIQTAGVALKLAVGGL